MEVDRYFVLYHLYIRAIVSIVADGYVYSTHIKLLSVDCMMIIIPSQMMSV